MSGLDEQQDLMRLLLLFTKEGEIQDYRIYPYSRKAKERLSQLNPKNIGILCKGPTIESLGCDSGVFLPEI